MAKKKKVAKKKVKRPAKKVRKKKAAKKARKKPKKRTAYPGPHKGPASEFYHFTLVDKKNFGEFRVLERPQFGHVYSKDMKHARDRFQSKFGTRTFPKGTEIVVGKRKAGAKASSWMLGKTKKPRSWVIHKIMIPLSSRVLSRNPKKAEPKQSGVMKRLWDAIWGGGPQPVAPTRMPQMVALVYELFEGYETDPATRKQEPVSRFLIYLSQAVGETPEEAATNMAWQLKNQWDQRRADDFGLISLTIVWFDASSRQYNYELVYGEVPPKDILSRLIGMITVPPTPGAPPGPAAPEIRVRRPPPAPRGAPSTIQSEGYEETPLPEVSVRPAAPPPKTPTPSAAGAPGGMPGMPGITGMPGMPPPSMGGAAPPSGGPTPTPTETFRMGAAPPGMEGTTQWWEKEWKRLHKRNPFLQERITNNPNYHVSGKFGRLGDVDFMVHEQLPGGAPAQGRAAAAPAKIPASLPPPSSAVKPATGVPGGVTPPEEVVAQAKKFEDEMRTWHQKQQAALRSRAANPRKKSSKKKKKAVRRKAGRKKKAKVRKATTRKKPARKKTAKRKPAKRKATRPKKSVRKKVIRKKPAKKSSQAISKMRAAGKANMGKHGAKALAILGYVVGEKLTSPRTIKKMKVDEKGNVLAMLDNQKTFASKLGKKITVKKLWTVLKGLAKLTPSEKKVADKVFKKKIPGM